MFTLTTTEADEFPGDEAAGVESEVVEEEEEESEEESEDEEEESELVAEMLRQVGTPVRERLEGGAGFRTFGLVLRLPFSQSMRGKKTVVPRPALGSPIPAG